MQGLVGKQTPEVQSGGMIGPWALAWNLSLILRGSWMGLRAGTDALYCLGWRGVQAWGMGVGKKKLEQSRGVSSLPLWASGLVSGVWQGPQLPTME